MSLLINFRNDPILKTDPRKAISPAEQKRLAKAGYDLDWITAIQTEGGLRPDDDHIDTGNGPFAILTITKYQTHPRLLWLMQFSHESNTIMMLDSVTNESEKVTRDINRSLDELMDRTRNGRHITDMDEAATQAQELREYAASLGNDGEISKSILIRLVIYETTQERLEQHVSEIKRSLRANGYHAVTRFYVQSDEFQTINEPLPMQLKAWNGRGIDRRHDIQDVRARVLGGGANMSAQQLVDPNGAFLGSTSTGGAFIFDPYRKTKQRLSFNGMILGSMGAGKSTLMKMLEEASFARNDYIRVIDRNGEYTDLIKAQGGKVISLDGRKGHMLNPLQVLATVLKEGDHGEYEEVDEAESFHQHLSKVRVLVKMVSNNSLNEYELNELTKLLRLFYINLGLLPKDWAQHPEKIHITQYKAEDYPTFSNFLDFMKQIISPEFLSQNGVSIDKQTQYEHIENIIDNIVNENGDIFDGKTDIGDLKDAKVMVFDMRNLSGSSEPVQRAQIFMALTMIWNASLTIGRRQNYLLESGAITKEEIQHSTVFIDECHNIINPQNIDGTRYVAAFEREMRKYNAGAWFATQSPQEMAPEKLNRADQSVLKEVFEFTQYKWTMKQDSSQVSAIKRLLGDTLTDTDYRKLTELERGEAIVTSSGTKQRFNVTLEPTKRQLELFKGGQ